MFITTPTKLLSNWNSWYNSGWEECAITVGMAIALLDVSPSATRMNQEKAGLRNLYGQMQAYCLRQTDEGHTHGSNTL